MASVPIVVDGLHFRQYSFGTKDHQDHCRYRDNTADSTIEHSFYSWFAINQRVAPNHLHGLNKKTIAEHSQANSIINQNNYYQREQDGYGKQDKADPLNILIEIIH
jgi:hypothetical protein